MDQNLLCFEKWNPQQPSGQQCTHSCVVFPMERGKKLDSLHLPEGLVSLPEEMWLHSNLRKIKAEKLI